MDADFDSWNKLKKEISDRDVPFIRFPQKGEVWMSILGKNIGFEQNGSGVNFSRPVLIIKKFNNHMFWAIPLSTKQKDLDFYFNFTDPTGQSVSAILAQLKLMSIQRLGRKLYDMDPEKMARLKTKLRLLL